MSRGYVMTSDKAYAYENGYFLSGMGAKKGNRSFNEYRQPRLHVFSDEKDRDDWIKRGNKRAGRGVECRTAIDQAEVRRLESENPWVIASAIKHGRASTINLNASQPTEAEVARNTRRRVDAMVMEHRQKMLAKREKQALEFDGYCSRCRTRHKAVDVMRTQDSLGRPVLRGTCSVCGAIVKKNLPTKKQRQEMEVTGKAIAFEGYCAHCKTRHKAKDGMRVTDTVGRPVLRGTCETCGCIIKKNLPMRS